MLLVDVVEEMLETKLPLLGAVVAAAATAAAVALQLLDKEIMAVVLQPTLQEVAEAQALAAVMELLEQDLVVVGLAVLAPLTQ